MGRATERGILFSAPMIRAILAGAKTQTRRVLRGTERAAAALAAMPPTCIARVHGQTAEIRASATGEGWWARCPYGAAGDRLWVRETWRTEERASDLVDGIRLAADDSFHPIANTREAADAWVDAHDNGKHAGWRPAIFMPRWASRLTLEVTSVRVERVQQISEDDARAEGVAPWREPGQEMTAHERFRELWDSINGERAPWASDPWVWCVEFKRVQP